MSIISEIDASGEEVQALIFNNLMPSLEGEPLGHGLLAMTTLSLYLMKPDIKIEELQHCVEQTMEFMVMVLASTEPFDSSKIN
jgi:hypothetical protein